MLFNVSPYNGLSYYLQVNINRMQSHRQLFNVAISGTNSSITGQS
jgi:hypothetical protein